MGDPAAAVDETATEPQKRSGPGVRAEDDDTGDSPVLGHKAEKIAAEVLFHIRDAAPAGEVVRAVFRANSLRPLANFVAITNVRIVVGDTTDQGRKYLKRHVLVDDLAEYNLRKYPGSTPRLRVLTKTGEDVFLTQMLHRQDNEAVDAALARLMAKPGPAEVIAAARQRGLTPYGTGSAATPPRVALVHDDARRLLSLAAAAAEAGDITHEEGFLRDVMSLAGRAPLLSRTEVRQWLRLQIDRDHGKGLIRRGATLLGAIESIRGEGVTVFSDRILHGIRVHRMDPFVSAAVQLDGNVVVSHRPTLTRMMVGSVLPGTALIPGLAFQKKQEHDNRTATVTISHPEWSVGIAINPDQLASPRSIAGRINATADQLQRQEALPTTDIGANNESDRISKLERIAALLAQGLITQEQASTLRDDVMR
ncbi:hypothetical protein [Pseudonocardia sp. ICBG1034]|uniref:hypothetical protein n=1 Tax=Pseudonocardia sp. ICBG1034 TaxID=2844381 RepID=UPI001CCB4023|nr:hypothetical protein [Pseudonocardia sp. ICBG1034]